MVTLGMPEVGEGVMKNRILADPERGSSTEICIILGVNVCEKIIKSVAMDRDHNMIALETSFGTAFLGSYVENCGEKGVVSTTTVENITDELNLLIQKFWAMDEIANTRTRTEEEEKVEKLFLERYWRDSNGRFTVAIPLKKGIECIGSSREIALKRFYMLERKLNSNSDIRENYIKFMREYEDLGHMQVVDNNVRSGMVYHIPHHCVTSKFRVVFDASCKTDKGISLNEMQLLGEKLQRDLQDIIMRFRRHKVAFVADIKMMFRQVKIVRDQWD